MGIRRLVPRSTVLLLLVAQGCGGRDAPKAPPPSSAAAAPSAALVPVAVPAPPTVPAVPATPAPAAVAPDTAPVPEPPWPRVYTSNDGTISVYPPQLEAWEKDKLRARAAVKVDPTGSTTSSYGVVTLEGRTEVDRPSDAVILSELAVTKKSFPGSKDDGAWAVATLLANLPTGIQLSLQRIEAQLSLAKTEKPTAVAVKNDPPRILFSPTPAILVLVDGTPAQRPVPNSTLLRIINTPGLLVLDPASGKLYLWARKRWYEASAIEGPWAASAAPPATLEPLRTTFVGSKQVDAFDAPPDTPPSPTPPALIVSTKPAEIIVTAGEPAYAPIEGTKILYATNTDSHLFVSLASQETYVLLSGRWFVAKSVKGPWRYVAPATLPADFAKIPSTHAAGDVLAAVPKTPEAQEAAIANTVPQTATVKRSEATITSAYDGPPKFVPIAGTSLAYAVNSPVPVIQVSPTSFYSVANGVWLVGGTPTGPWAVATSVPPAIYGIPASCPLHYVTYVYVYGYTPEVVYVGYTPGYYGTVLTPDYVVVYGTGYVYPPYVGTIWVPPPPTFGFHVAIGFGAGGAGWGVGFHYGSPYGAGFGMGFTYVHHSGATAYNRWGAAAAVNRAYYAGRADQARLDNRNPGGPNGPGQRPGQGPGQRPGQGPGAGPGAGPRPTPHAETRSGTGGAGERSPFAGSDGRVYRPSESGKGWEQHDGKDFTPSRPPPPPVQHNLDADRNARSVGDQRVDSFRSGGGGGRGRGGGGRR